MVLNAVSPAEEAKQGEAMNKRHSLKCQFVDLRGWGSIFVILCGPLRAQHWAH